MASGREDTSDASRLKHVIKAYKAYNIRDGSYEQVYDFQAFETSLPLGRTPPPSDLQQPAPSCIPVLEVFIRAQQQMSNEQPFNETIFKGICLVMDHPHRGLMFSTLASSRFWPNSWCQDRIIN
jgi:hypothetical protein